MKTLNTPFDQLLIFYSYDGNNLSVYKIVELDYFEGCNWPIKQAFDQHIPGEVKFHILNYSVFGNSIIVCKPADQKLNIEAINYVWNREFNS